MSSPMRTRNLKKSSLKGLPLGISSSQQNFNLRVKSPQRTEPQIKKQILESKKDLKNLITETHNIKQAEAQEMADI